MDKKEKNKKIFIKKATLLLKDYFQSIKNDVIQNIINNSEINKVEMYDDLKLTLKQILKKFVQKNPNTQLKPIIIGSTTKARNNVNELEEINNSFYSSVNNLFSAYLTERTDLIFSTLLTQFEKVNTNTVKTFQETNEKIQRDMFDLKIQASNIIVFNENQRMRLRKINDQISFLQNQLQNRIDNKNSILTNEFITSYNKTILKNKPTSIAKNEINHFSSRLSKEESKTLQNFTYIAVKNIKLQKDEAVKMWQHKKYLKRTARSTHVDLNGVVIPADSFFDVENPRTGSIEKAFAPRDAMLSPENSINCECECEYFTSYKEL